MRKLKFYLIGLSLGLIFVFLILNEKNASCSYFPNDRVIAETLTKEFQYEKRFTAEMRALQLNETFVKDSILSQGKIDFDRSNAQKTPCPEYLIFYPSKKPKYEMLFEKCKDTANFRQISLLK